MPEDRRRRPDRKRLLIGPFIALAIVAVLLLAALLIRGGEPPATPAAPLPPTVPVALPALPPPPLTRTEIVQTANAAAAAYASGAPPSTTRSPLIGREFALRIPLGCAGPGGAPAAAQATVELEPKTATLKLQARPAVWTGLPALQGLDAAERIETIEGFWIPRPWTNSEACPPARDIPLPATPTPATAETVGLARVFQKGGSRILMRGARPYEYVVRSPKPGGPDLNQRFTLVLEGRLVGFSDGQATRCWSESPYHRPICIYAVEYDRVAFEEAQSHKTLAEWRE
jgi:hypothetical protein